MNIETLKLILGTVEGVSGDAMTVAVSYIVMDKILPFIVVLVALYVSYRVAMAIVNAVKAVEYIKSIRDRYMLGVSGHLAENEFIRVKNFIDDKIRESEMKK